MEQSHAGRAEQLPLTHQANRLVGWLEPSAELLSYLNYTFLGLGRLYWKLLGRIWGGYWAAGQLTVDNGSLSWQSTDPAYYVGPLSVALEDINRVHCHWVITSKIIDVYYGPDRQRLRLGCKQAKNIAAVLSERATHAKQAE